jgi:hypothetical protein
MDTIKIRYEEEHDDVSISGSHEFSVQEIESFFNHFERRNNQTIPEKDIIKKLLSDNILTPEELEKVEISINSPTFQEFISYVNTFRQKKYRHTLRPWCNKVAEKLQALASNIISNPGSWGKIRENLREIYDMPMLNMDPPYAIKTRQILAAVQATNVELQNKEEFEAFEALPFIDSLKKDNFQIKYDAERKKILFIDPESNWYIVLGWERPKKIKKDDSGSYTLELTDGSCYIIRIQRGEFHNTLVAQFNGKS